MLCTGERRIVLPRSVSPVLTPSLRYSRAMAPASKEAPFVFEFIANKESHKFDEIEAHSEVNVSVYNTKLVPV